MSKKKIYSKHLEKGKFYIHSDGHKGHPALLFKKIDKKNKYLILVLLHHQVLEGSNSSIVLSLKKYHSPLCTKTRQLQKEENWEENHLKELKYTMMIK